MPASISLHDLSWSRPDGQPVLTQLNLTFGAERVGLVGRNGVGKSTLLRLICGELSPGAGQLDVVGRTALLRQIARPHADETLADLFGIRDRLAVLAKAAAGVADAEALAQADWTLENRFGEAVARMGLEAQPETRLMSLSGGQTTRAALAALTFDGPDFLLLDEPTNNLDQEGRLAVRQMLAGWRGGAIVVSHDRELLEEMDAIVELTGLGARRYGGNWSSYRQLKAAELAAAQHDLEAAEHQLEEARRAAQQARERQDRRIGSGARKAAAGGIPKIVAGGLKRRAQATAGRLDVQGATKSAEAEEALADARAKVEVLQPFTVDLPSSGLPAGRVVAEARAVTAGYAPDEPILHDFELRLVGPERVAVTGPNGAGKSTLLSVLTGALTPQSGSAEIAVDWALLDQRMSLLDPLMSIEDNFRRHHPETDRNTCRAALARFGFRADAALQIAGTLSGGQMLRVGLAAVLGHHPPQLLILDEPTNHLDIEAIETIEAGLRAYDGALLVVSHDAAFLEAIGITRWIVLGS